MPKILIAVCAMLTSVAFAANIVSAAPATSLPNAPALQAATTPTVSPTPGAQKHVDALVERFDIDSALVKELEDKLHGWGQIFHALYFAEKTGASAEEIQAMRADGMGWGEIAHELKVKPGLHGDNLGATISGRDKTKTPEPPRGARIQSQTPQPTRGAGIQSQTPQPTRGKENGSENGNTNPSGERGDDKGKPDDHGDDKGKPDDHGKENEHGDDHKGK
ncbi:MAG: hypothetical protein HY327_02435 [Chloroflexi bacterium]|nr:hypothetical protein [Chloroflexota bacterium]